MKNIKSVKIGKAILLLTLATMLFSVQKIAYPGIADFSGNWIRNNEQCDADGLSINSIPAKIEISQSNNAISIKRTSVSGAGISSSYTEVLKFDGSSSETVTPAKLKRTAKIELRAGMAGFTETFTSKDEQGNEQQSGKQEFSLVNNGKGLKIEATQSYKDGTVAHLSEAFDKK